MTAVGVSDIRLQWSIEKISEKKRKIILRVKKLSNFESVQKKNINAFKILNDNVTELVILNEEKRKKNGNSPRKAFSFFMITDDNQWSNTVYTYCP